MYAKVHRSLWDGTLAECWEGWAVFVFLLAHCDAEGVVDMTPAAIVRRSGLPAEVVERGLAELLSPDAGSRTSDEGGRRIVLLDEHRDWGWLIVNRARYRDLKDLDEVRAQNRERVRRYRDRQRNAESRSVTHGNAPSPQTERETETEKKKQHPCRISSDVGPSLKADWSDFFHQHVWPKRPRLGAPGFAAAESRKVALASWERLFRPHDSADELSARCNLIADALEQDVAAMRSEGREAKKCPHLSTWLNQERWGGSHDAG